MRAGNTSANEILALFDRTFAGQARFGKPHSQTPNKRSTKLLGVRLTGFGGEGGVGGIGGS
jgi:hypothetical protein